MVQRGGSPSETGRRRGGSLACAGAWPCGARTDIPGRRGEALRQGRHARPHGAWQSGGRGPSVGSTCYPCEGRRCRMDGMSDDLCDVKRTQLSSAQTSLPPSRCAYSPSLARRRQHHRARRRRRLEAAIAAVTRQRGCAASPIRRKREQELAGGVRADGGAYLSILRRCTCPSTYLRVTTVQCAICELQVSVLASCLCRFGRIHVLVSCIMARSNE